MAMKTISVAKLRKLGACSKQVDKFQSIFGNGPVKVTVELCVAHAQNFNWDWAAKNLLTAPAWAEYLRVTAPALTEFERAIVAAQAEYERATAPPWAEYEHATAPPWAKYRRAIAPAWATAYLNQ
jgi:hypothetical protein